ncbi:hypothetical protein [Uliginosibacterium sp. TH139]|uniref:hypothetical protein n=1 Tax=Uliginosibacterium sp. TH139 TaxID=2067453 RepID=UPI0013041CD9|nr:hypothetical protein [Uliginosibacterium sp. TH139]
MITGPFSFLSIGFWFHVSTHLVILRAATSASTRTRKGSYAISAMKFLLISVLALPVMAIASGFPALNPDVRQNTLQQTICRKGYSATVRPSTSFTNPIKYRFMGESGIPLHEASDWALDHRIAIALGGHPRQLSNFQLLSSKANGRKSRIEVKLLCLVCTGDMPLAQAQRELVDDWQGAYRRYARHKCSRR